MADAKDVSDRPEAQRIEKKLKWFRVCATAEESQRKREKDDLAFQVAEYQWPEDVRRQRGATTVQGTPIPARPMLSVAPVDEPIQLVSNQERATHLAASFHPLSEDADDTTAQVLQGLYDISANESNAGVARSWAYERVLWCGTGWYRLDTVYDPEGGHPFDQKIIWRRIKQQGSVYTDPYCQYADKRDRRFQFITEDIPLEVYKQRYPKSAISEYGNSDFVTLGNDWPGWIGGDDEDSRTIRVAECWHVELDTRTWDLYDDGGVYSVDADEDAQKPPDGVKKVTGDDARSRVEETRCVYWSTINCVEELEPEQALDCQWIPLIPVLGRELQPFDGKDRTIGMISNAKDAARLVNYSASGAVETAALEPRAPFMWDPRQIAGFEPWWQQSNTRNFSGLPYNAIVDGQLLPPPQRTQVDVGRLGPNMQILSMGGAMLQSAMSTFDPALGKQPTAHRSGEALKALQSQTFEANSHYLDNLATISIPYEALVWLDWAPYVYDRPGRVIRILQGENQKSALVTLGQDPSQNQIDLNAGRYGVSVIVGKSSASRLQQGQDALSQVIQAEPQLLNVVGPEWMRFQDFPGSKTLAQLLQKNRDHLMPWLATQPDQTMQLQQQVQQLQAQLQQLTVAAQKMKQDLDTDAVKHQAQITMKQMEIASAEQIKRMDDATKIEVARITAAKEGIIAEREMAEERLATGLKIAADREEGQQQRAHEVAMAGVEHNNTITQARQTHNQALQAAEVDNAHALQQADAQRQVAEAGSQQDDDGA